MKKFRTAASAALALTAATALAACSPPHEKPSDSAVKDVSEGPSTPAILSTGTEEPTTTAHEESAETATATTSAEPLAGETTVETASVVGTGF